MKPKRVATRDFEASRKADLQLIHGAFAAHLRAVGYAEPTMSNYRRCLVNLAQWLGKRGRRLRDLDRARVDQIVRSKGGQYRRMRCEVLHRWLRFLGRCAVHSSAAWRPWLEDFGRFLANDKGLGPSTCRYNEVRVERFLKWRFRSGPARWSQVQVEDIRRFAMHCAAAVKPRTANNQLSCLRQFLRFVQLRGACSRELAEAVPHVANFGHSVSAQVLSERQRCRLLASIPRHSSEGKRDFAIILCLSELGLRCAEAVHLRLGDIDWTQRRLSVPPVKNARRGRQLPLPCHVASALRDYIDNGRPPSDGDHIFLRHHKFFGQPVSDAIVRHMLRETFRRCALPKELAGTHKLRYTFASRLFARGATLKQIADLLGHQRVATATIYTHVDLHGLRQVARPWPS